MVILMLEPFDEKILPVIEIQISTKRRFNCYHDMSSVNSFIEGDHLAQAIKCLLDIPSILQANNNQSWVDDKPHDKYTHKSAGADVQEVAGRCNTFLQINFLFYLS